MQRIERVEQREAGSAQVVAGGNEQPLTVGNEPAPARASSTRSPPGASKTENPQSPQRSCEFLRKPASETAPDLPVRSSGAGTRTQNPLINSQMLCRLSYPGPQRR